MLTGAIADWMQEQGLTRGEVARRSGCSEQELSTVLRRLHRVRGGLLELGCPVQLVFPALGCPATGDDWFDNPSPQYAPLR